MFFVSSLRGIPLDGPLRLSHLDLHSPWWFLRLKGGAQPAAYRSYNRGRPAGPSACRIARRNAKDVMIQLDLKKNAALDFRA